MKFKNRDCHVRERRISEMAGLADLLVEASAIYRHIFEPFIENLL